MCRVYGQSYRDTMGMPMRAFWQLSGFVDRLHTAEGIDHLTLLISAQSPAGAKEQLEVMQKAAPNPYELSGHARAAASAVRDQEGFNALRGMQ